MSNVPAERAASPIEIWKDIAGYGGIYQVSNFGKVRSTTRTRFNGSSENAIVTGKEMQGFTRLDGYVIITLCDGEKSKKKYLHRLVATAFIQNPQRKRTVNHIDGNPNNNNVNNLEWSTYSENHIHAFIKLGRKPTRGNKGNLGESNKKSIKVAQISNGKEIATYHGMREAERKTGIRNGAISAVCQGKYRTAGGYEWKIK